MLTLTSGAITSIALVHLMAAISPGPAFVVSVRTAASKGFGEAAFLAWGIGLGATLWAFAALAGLSLLFEAYPPARLGLSIAGAAFLIYLGLTIYRHAAQPLDMATGGAQARPFRLGVMTQLANPKPAIFFGAVFVNFIPDAATFIDKAFILAMILINESLWYCLTAWLFSRQKARAIFLKAKTLIERLFGIVLALLGVLLILG